MMKNLYFTKGLRASLDPCSFLPIAWQVYKSGTATLAFKTEQELREYMRKRGSHEITAQQYNKAVRMNSEVTA